MSIQVKFFASLREQIGISALELHTASSAQDAWHQATQNQPIPNNLLVAVNLEYSKLNTPLQDGDEVAFFPPVTGG